jgi:xanthine dehydrogenase accessory factor
MARIAGYDVKVVDVRPDRGTESMLDPVEITANTYVVLTTEDHLTDEQALRDVLPTPAAYIGMIGSRKKKRNDS